MARGLSALVALRVLLVLVLILVGLVAVFLFRIVILLFFVGRNDRGLLALGGECNPFAVGRPVEFIDGFLAARQLKTRAGRDIHNPQLPNVLIAFPVRLAHAIDDVAPIGRNLMAADALQAELLIDGRRVFSLSKS